MGDREPGRGGPVPSEGAGGGTVRGEEQPGEQNGHE
jgi:hypothetical protein